MTIKAGKTEGGDALLYGTTNNPQQGSRPIGWNLLEPENVPVLVELDASGNPIRTVTPDGQVVGVGGGAVQDGLYVVTVEEQDFALLPLDEDGDLTANIGHRRGLVANLLSLDGVDGEISVPTDTEDLVIHNGIEGQARRFKSGSNTTALGPNSIAVGEGAATAARARNSLALGAGASAQTIGETVFSGAIAGVETRVLTFAARSTSASPVFATCTGIADDTTPGASSGYTPAGIYDIELVILARQIGTNNWARFVRRCTVFVESTGGTATMTNITIPIVDVNFGLVGLAINLFSFAGGPLLGQFTGLAATTIQWSMFARMNGLTITA